jgi:hypothetical protein
MRRFLVLLFFGAMAAVGIWLGLRGQPTQGGASGTVAALLPRETLALVHLPDVKRMRAEWHESDLYKLWREPAVQDFLQKPLAGASAAGTAQRKFAQLEQLQMKDAFFAVISWENKQLKMLGGFRFKGSEADAEKVIGNLRAQLQENAAKRETVTYQRHQIEVVTRDAATIATVYAGDWFLAANDLPSLQALLDRVERRVKDPATTLAADENFTASLKHMPAGYSVLAYARPDRYVEQLTRSLPPDQPNAEQLAKLRNVRSIIGASAFEHGKIRDVLFVTTPQLEQLPALQRSSLAFATNDTFLYFAGMLGLANQPQAPGVPATAAGLPGMLQPMMAAVLRSGVTRDDWNAAFGPELSVIGDWVENTRLPALLASVPVKDATKAQTLITTLTTGADQSSWTATQRDNVQYFTLPPTNPMVPLSPTIALSEGILIAGQDPDTVAAAMQRRATSWRVPRFGKLPHRRGCGAGADEFLCLSRHSPALHAPRRRGATDAHHGSSVPPAHRGNGRPRQAPAA